MAAPKRSFEGADRELASAMLKQARLDVGLSKTAIADMMGVHPSTWNSYVRGGPPPKREDLDRLASQLEKHPDYRFKKGELVATWFSSHPVHGRFDAVFRTHDAGFAHQMHGLDPRVVLWFHKLRSPHLIHGLFALAAGAALTSGRQVRLLVDDLGLKNPGQTLDNLRRAVAHWLGRADADATQLDVRRFSEILGPMLADGLAGEVLARYFAPSVRATEFLRAAKVVVPINIADGPAEWRVGRDHMAAKLLTPVWNALVLDLELEGLRGEDGSPAVTVTLGGEDEEPLWAFWRGTADEQVGAATGHLFLDRMPIGGSPWDYEELQWGVPHAEHKIAGLIERAGGNPMFLEWMFRATVVLPRLVGIHVQSVANGRALETTDDVRTAAIDDVPSVSRMLAEAVMKWFPPQ